MSQRQLFGTDGIRGVAGEPPLDPATVFAFGAALGEWAQRTASAAQAAPSHAKTSNAARVLIGMDTRESGPWLAETVAAGLLHSGVQPVFAGIITTPGVAYLTKTQDFVAGVMISASHNPYRDNGLKVFDHTGSKLPDSKEHELEKRIFAFKADGPAPARLTLTADAALSGSYLDMLAAQGSPRLAGIRVALDCANGAASALAAELFERLGATVIPIHAEPTGVNINLKCGALHPEVVMEQVLSLGADAGAAFDGDADRCILVSNTGKIIDGDHVLLINARAMKAAGTLGSEDAVVATLMSNLGLERALQQEGMNLLRTSVGDKYVLEEMLRSGLNLGGEQSGHVIFRDCSTTGDGMLTAVRTLSLMREARTTLDDLTSTFVRYPQKLVNVRFTVKRPLEQLPEVQREIEKALIEFGDAGRVNVRFSGTEPLARVMVEGPEESRVRHHAENIAACIKVALSE